MAISYKIIGRHIKAARKAKGFTQEQAAEMLGITTVHYARWERAERCINLPRLAEISQKFCVPLEHLLAGCVSNVQPIIPENSIEAIFLEQMNRYAQCCGEDTLNRMLRICEALAAEEMEEE